MHLLKAQHLSFIFFLTAVIGTEASRKFFVIIHGMITLLRNIDNIVKLEDRFQTSHNYIFTDPVRRIYILGNILSVDTA